MPVLAALPVPVSLPSPDADAPDEPDPVPAVVPMVMLALVVPPALSSPDCMHPIAIPIATQSTRSTTRPGMRYPGGSVYSERSPPPIS